MRKIITFSIIILTYLFLGKSVLLAQDLHYSQFYHSPLNVSPGLTGLFNGDQRYMASVRDQWRAVPVPWFSFSLGYDQKLYPKKAKNHFYGIGLMFNYDQQGDSRLNLSNLNIAGNYSRILSKQHILSLGALIGYASRGFNMETLTWDKQWNGRNFDANLATGETFESTRFNMMESAIGLNYLFQKSSRTNTKIGTSIYHILGNGSQFENGNINRNPGKVPSRKSAYFISNWKLTSGLDIQFDGLYQSQNSYSELLFGSYLNIYVNKKRGKQTNLHVGAGYRTSKSLYPKVALRYNSLFVALSYDIDLSEFSFHTDNKGGPEIHVNYILTHVKPGKDFRICPIF